MAVGKAESEHAHPRLSKDSEKDSQETHVSVPDTDEDVKKPVKFEEGQYPDGGFRAWLIVFGTMLSTFSTFGLVNCWGVFQEYYQNTILHDSSPSSIAWIGSIQFSFVFLPGIITGRMFDLGYFKIPYTIASALLVTATFLVAECKQYWQFLLCQGFATGIACGFIFGPTMGVIGHWFKFKRGVALGISASGASFSGLIFPIMCRKLIPIIGFKWTMRTLGFILMAALTIANLVIARRLPPVNARGGLLNLRAFTYAPYTVYCLSGFCSFLGLYTLLTYVDVSAVAVGIDPEFAFYLVSIINGASGCGRAIAGLLVDKYGPINVMAPMTLVAAGLSYGWPFLTNKGGFVAVAAIYGFSSGAFISTFVAPVFELGSVEDVGRRTGMMLTISAAGALCGPPISGAIIRAMGETYKGAGYFAGSIGTLAVCLMWLTKYLVKGSLRGKF